MAGVPLMPTLNRQPTPSYRTRTLSLLFVAGIIIIILAGLIIGGLYLFKRYTNSRVDKLRAEIAAFRSEVQSEEVQNMFHTAQAIQISEGLLNTHTRVSPLFPKLAAETLKTVRYNSFAYAPREHRMTLSAVSIDDKTFAEQLEVLRRAKNVFATMDFDNLTLNPNDTVSFTVSLSVAPAAIDKLKP